MHKKKIWKLNAKELLMNIKTFNYKLITEQD